MLAARRPLSGNSSKASRLFRAYSAKTDPKKVSSVDLSSALKNTSKLRVTSKEYRTLDTEIEPSSGKDRRRESRAFAKEIDRKVIPAIPRFREKKGPFLPKRFTSEVKNHQFSPDSAELEQVDKLSTKDIPTLAHGLDRALFLPGVHFLQDPRTRIYNFLPVLKKIIKFDDFDWDQVDAFVSVSKDKLLLSAAIAQNKRFYSSTSSMTSVLSQFYLLFNNYQRRLERFPYPGFSRSVVELPASVVVVPKGKNPETKEAIYAVESDKSADNEILLGAMGHCLEAFLTTGEEEFNRKYNKKHEKSAKNDCNADSNTASTVSLLSRQTYNYASYGDFIMRSQLDCYDSRLPGNGTFDLKTRSACAIRYDNTNPSVAENTYQIWKLRGKFESFEREFEDLIRTGALLKYGFQARIGQMDGIYVAYHNINTFFGFQYLPLTEIDNILFSHQGHPPVSPQEIRNLDDVNDDLPLYVAEHQFRASLEVWQELLKQIIRDIKAGGEHRDTAFRMVVKSAVHKDFPSAHTLHVSAVPIASAELDKLQSFSRNYQTSFRAGISDEKRYANLNKHRRELNAFNKKIAESGVLNYKVRVQQLFDGKEAVGEHPYPSSKGQKWSISYTIKQVEPGPFKHLSQLKKATSMLTVAYEQNGVKRDGKSAKEEDSEEKDEVSEKEDEEDEIVLDKSDLDLDEADQTNPLRVYSAVGRLRAKAWEEKDQKAVEYERRG